MDISSQGFYSAFATPQNKSTKRTFTFLTKDPFFLTCAVCNCNKTTAMWCMCWCFLFHLSCGELSPVRVILPAAGLCSALHSEKVEAPHQLAQPTDDITLWRNGRLKAIASRVWLQDQCCSSSDVYLGHDCYRSFKLHLSSTDTPVSSTLA